MAVAVSNTKLPVYNTEVLMVSNAATADTADLAEVFTITPTRDGSKVAIIIGGTAFAIAWSFAVGTQWGSISTVTGSAAAATEEVIIFDSSRVLSATGTIVLTLTPASGKKLLTDSAAYVKVIEGPF